MPALGCLFDPAMQVGCGGFGYVVNQGADLVCDPSGRWGLMADADLPGVGGGALYSISRGNGAQTNPRPVAGRVTHSGYAYDGTNRLWGSLFNVGGVLNLVNPQTGIGVAVPMAGIPINILDMASDECFSCAEDDHDVGDAPDSTNHFSAPMLAYPAVQATFPSVLDLGTGIPPGPFHRLSSQDSWLGDGVNAEYDADWLPDADLVTNIGPLGDIADRDGLDDGVVFPLNLPACRMTQFNYVITVKNWTRYRYTNVWLDFNRNGQWGDQIQCIDPDTQQLATVNEWAVQDQLTSLGVGVHVVMAPPFRSLDPGDRMWMRITLAETTAPPGASDGRGYDAGYEIGEVEDYILKPIDEGIYDQ